MLHHHLSRRASGARARHRARLTSCLLILVLLISGALHSAPISITQAAAVDFPDRLNFGTGSDYTNALATGDMDGDGDLDIVVGNTFEQNVVYLNDGAHKFDVGRNFGTGNDATTSLAVGDMDGDGDLDIVVGNGGQQSAVYLNNGLNPPSFTASVPFGTPTDSTSSVALGDMDGDGNLDIVVGNAGQQSAVYLNSGAVPPVFTSAIPFGPAADSTISVAVGDADGDGDLDIAAGNAPSGAAFAPDRLYLNDGQSLPSFGTAHQIGSANDQTTTISFGDVDGDDDLDIVVGGFGQGLIHFNDGAGNYTTSTAYGIGATVSRTLTLGDIDGDGDIDIVTGNVLQPNLVFVNDGSGNFPAILRREYGTRGNDNVGEVALGDMDNDGDLDIVVGQILQQNRIFLNDGAGDLERRRPFGSGGPPTMGIASGDLNGDQLPDLVVGQFEAPGAIYFSAPGGTFTNGGSFGSGNDPVRQVHLADLDGDGDLDLLAATFGQDRLFLNDGQGGFAHGTIVCGVTPAVICLGDGADNTWSLTPGDVDRDGDIDIVATNLNAQSLIYLNSGGRTPSFTTIRLIGIGQVVATEAALGDVDQDGDIDIALANPFGLNAIYLNDGASPPSFTSSIPFGTGNDTTLAVDMADMDGDGDLDIIAGNSAQTSAVYLNSGGPTPSFATSVLFGGNDKATESVAARDIDGDGDRDIVAGNNATVGGGGQPDYVYLNNGAATPAFSTAIPFGLGTDHTLSVAVDDFDGDGDLDIASGNFGEQGVVALNSGATPPAFVTRPYGPGQDVIASVALGDMDGDGDLDLVAGEVGAPDSLYLNDGQGNFAERRAFGSVNDSTLAIAVGDLDGDGDLDVVAGNNGQPSVIYANDGSGHLAPIGVLPGSASAMHSLALGDLDGDGDLDLVVANDRQYNAVFFNTGHGSFQGPALFGRSDEPTASVALGDLDGDGDLDAVTGNVGMPNQVYLNNGFGALLPGGTFGAPSDNTFGVALGDIDGDGDLDVAAGNSGQQSTVFLNRGDGSFEGSRNFGSGVDKTSAVLMADIDLDRDLDLMVSNTEQQSTIAVNDGDGRFGTTRGIGVGSEQTFGIGKNTNLQTAVGDLDGDGDNDLALANGTQQSFVYLNGRTQSQRLSNNPPEMQIIHPGPTADGALRVSPAIIEATEIPIHYRLTDREGDPVREIKAFYSLDGGGSWRPALAAAGTQTKHLATAPAGSEHIFTWDTFTSDFFGQSDNVIFRIEAYPESKPAPRGAAPLNQWPYSPAHTTQLRVRGTQVRVLQNGQPAANALVYRLPKGQARGGALFADGAGQPFRLDAQGYLQGRGAIAVGDRLVALTPVETSPSMTRYFTSARPTSAGLEAAVVNTPGVQVLSIAPTNPLILFNLDVSLEWDARNDPQFVSQLTFDLQRTSELLFTWSNGQIALGQVNVYHDRAHWDSAHVRVFATNRLRPNANQGGIVAEPISETVALAGAPATTHTIEYEPGQVRIGAVWNRYGESSGNLGEDWPRTLAHELGHFLLFLDDNYLNLDAARRLVTIEDCPGPMTDPYRDDYGLFHPDAGWQSQCASTLSNQNTGRSDWATIKRFYDESSFALAEPAAFTPSSAPQVLPLQVTKVNFIGPAEPAQALAVPVFSLSAAESGGRYLASTTSRAILYRREGDQVIDLGRPVLDQLTARGVRPASDSLPGDRLCVYDLAARPDPRVGCEEVHSGDEQIDMAAFPDWKPNLLVTAETSRTLKIDVSGLPAGLPLRARLFTSSGESIAPAALASAGPNYTGVLNLSNPALDGYVQLWVDEPAPRREAIVDYELGGNPGRARGRTAPRGSPGRARGRTTPAASSDGQVILFGDNLVFDEGQFYTVQAATAVNAPPTGRIAVGQGYWVQASPSAPDLRSATINIGYLTRDVPSGQEEGIRVYFWNGKPDTAWQPLDTALDVNTNEASAQLQGPGLYTLMTSVEIPLSVQGWNLIAYPVRGTHPIADALRSIDGAYTIVYSYQPGDAADPWKVYGVGVPSWVNDLQTLAFGQGYWIRATKPTMLYLDPAPAAQASALAATSLPIPPATYYGTLWPRPGVRPAAGVPVRATVLGKVCATGATKQIGGQIVFAIDVPADDGGAWTGCGLPGRDVVITIGNQTVRARWDNSQLWDISPRAQFLPLLHR
jgi:hypothetical protein